MPDSGRSGGSDDGPDYGWLYGGQQSPSTGAPSSPAAPTGSDDPEPTRMLPKMDRPESTSTSASRGGDGRRRSVRCSRPSRCRRPKQQKPRRKRPIGKIILLLLVAWIVFLIAVPLWAWSKIDKVDADPAGARPASQPGTTYLLVGSDSRKGLSKKEKKRLGAGGVGDVGQRTDTIMLLHTGSGPSMLLSIPRDSLVAIPGHGTTKINAAFAYGGPKLLVKTIEQNTGIRVDHYVEIGFGGFVNSVDAVGGITICPTQRMKDPRANLNIKKGCQEVDGVDRARLLAVAPRQQVRRHRPGPPPARGGQRDRLGGEVAVDLHQPGALLPGQRRRHVLAGDQQGHRPDRAGQVRAGDDPGQREQRADLRRCRSPTRRSTGTRSARSR